MLIPSNIFGNNLQFSLGAEVMGNTTLLYKNWDRKQPIFNLKLDCSNTISHPKYLKFIPNNIKLGIGNISYFYPSYVLPNGDYSETPYNKKEIGKILSGAIYYDIFRKSSDKTYDSKKIMVGILLYGASLIKSEKYKKEELSLFLIGPSIESEFQFGFMEQTTLRLNLSINLFYISNYDPIPINDSKKNRFAVSVNGALSTFFLLLK